MPSDPSNSNPNNAGGNDDGGNHRPTRTGSGGNEDSEGMRWLNDTLSRDPRQFTKLIDTALDALEKSSPRDVETVRAILEQQLHAQYGAQAAPLADVLARTVIMMYTASIQVQKDTAPLLKKAYTFLTEPQITRIMYLAKSAR